jgi:hypothetical protein
VIGSGLLLVRVDAKVLSTVLAGWLRFTGHTAAGRRWRLVIAIDGKILRGSRPADGSQVHLLAAYDTSTGVVLAQVQIAAKSTRSRRSPRRWTESKPNSAA